MSTPRRRVLAAFVLFALWGGSAGSLWHVKAQNGAPGRVPAETFAERIPPAPVSAGDRGATYHALEGTALKVTTKFPDAIAIAERGHDGQLSTQLTDLAGNEIAAFRVHRVDADHDSLEFTIPGGITRHVARRAGLRPTLDWSNDQAYSLWKDRNALESSALEWQDMLVRPLGAPNRTVGSEALQTDTEWAGGFSASVITKIGTHISYVTGRKGTGPVFISSFRQHGNEVGFSQWWPREQAFAWSFPGLTEGYVDAPRLAQNGGWTFVPDMAWMNTQNLAFHQFHTLVNTRASGRGPQRGSRAGDPGPSRAESTGGGWLDAIGRFIAPALHANEPGCDGLHWLDGSLFRPCCDSHDRCYAKAGCTANSWWMWWTSWRCDACNMLAVLCFATGSGGHILFRFP